LEEKKTMSDTPKFTVIDRRRAKAEEEQENPQSAEPTPAAPTAPSAGPQLVVNESKRTPEPEAAPVEAAADQEAQPELPPAPTAEQSREQKIAYEASSQRLEEIVRAQNPAAGPQPPIELAHLIQQFYVSAMIQMGAGAQEGQRPRIDILGARQTIDLLGVLAEKTKGNLTEAEDRTLQTALFEARLAFMELTRMITLQGMQPPPPPAPGVR
jgi:type IV secretory pathway VirB10-like protein